ncbi:MAG: prolyl oligopeptidase family serine peptidase [Saccharofermentans sp.]|nr:prolyl oligopeptidase family serine peptidase [Saccharofermentans sp.]
MEVIEFSNETKVDHVVAPWEKYMAPGDFVSYNPSYVGGAFLDKFEEHTQPASDVGDITYYLFTPDKSAYESGKKFKLLVFIHGATNALAGKVCVSHSGGEMFADAKRQAKMEGAYILVPLANEKTDENGELTDSWSEAYLKHLKAIIDRTIEECGDIDKVIIGGGSSGGYTTWKMLLEYPDFFAGAFPASGFTEDDSYLEALNTNTKLFISCAKYDEFGSFERVTPEALDAMKNATNAICFFPEFLRNGDKGVASLYFGIEMGQHCMITQIQADLMYDDGTPYLSELPEGMTGWFAGL